MLATGSRSQGLAHVGDAVALVCEPSNPYDPSAIRVQRLDGTKLGYIPREMTPRFPQATTFAHVHSVGQNSEGKFGFSVSH